MEDTARIWMFSLFRPLLTCLQWRFLSLLHKVSMHFCVFVHVVCNAVVWRHDYRPNPKRKAYTHTQNARHMNADIYMYLCT